MITSFIKVRRHFRSASNYRLETGFSMLEAVVVVGVLLALAIGGFFAFGPITENAKIAKVRSAASEVHTGVLVASMDGNSDTSPEKVIDDWNSNVSKIKVALVDSQGGNGDFCVSATNAASPHITHQTGSCVPGSGSSNPDIDGDGIPNESDPDIDGDGILNADDPTPNGETVASPGSGDSGSATPVSARCTNLSAPAEAACWMDILVAEEERWMAANSIYFGLPAYSGGLEEPYTGNEFDDMPLKKIEWMDRYNDPADPQWNYDDVKLRVLDRDGQLWEDQLYTDANQHIRYGIVDSGENLHYNCNFLTQSDMQSPVCKVAGIPGDTYRVKLSDNDATADADVRKVLEAQFAHAKNNPRLFYGGAEVVTDVTAWAGTTYTAKVWNRQDVNETGGQQIYTNIQITAPNGDIYNAGLQQWTGMAAPETLDHTSIHIYRHSATQVAEVCSKPYEDKHNQFADIAHCQMQGYTNFREPVA